MLFDKLRAKRDAAYDAEYQAQQARELAKIKDQIKPVSKDDLRRLQGEYLRLKRQRAAEGLGWTMFWRLRDFRAVCDLEIKGQHLIGSKLVAGSVLYVVTERDNEYDPSILKVADEDANVLGQISMNDEQARMAAWQAIESGRQALLLVKSRNGRALLLERELVDE